MKHVRWVTRRGPRRYEAVYDGGGCLRWRLWSMSADGTPMTLLHESSGGFYDDMPPAAPTWRQHHPSAMVELALAVRVHASQGRALSRWLAEWSAAVSSRKADVMAELLAKRGPARRGERAA